MTHTNIPKPAPPGGWPDVMDVPTAAAYVGVGEEEIRVRCREGYYKHARNGRGARAPYLLRKEWIDERIDGFTLGGQVPIAAA